MNNPMIGKLVRVFDKEGALAGTENYARLVYMDEAWVIVRIWEDCGIDESSFLSAHPTKNVDSIDTIGWDIYQDEDEEIPDHILNYKEPLPQDMSDFNKEDVDKFGKVLDKVFRNLPKDGDDFEE